MTQIEPEEVIRGPEVVDIRRATKKVGFLRRLFTGLGSVSPAPVPKFTKPVPVLRRASAPSSSQIPTHRLGNFNYDLAQWRKLRWRIIMVWMIINVIILAVMYFSKSINQMKYVALGNIPIGLLLFIVDWIKVNSIQRKHQLILRVVPASELSFWERLSAAAQGHGESNIKWTT